MNSLYCRYFMTPSQEWTFSVRLILPLGKQKPCRNHQCSKHGQNQATFFSQTSIHADKIQWSQLVIASLGAFTNKQHSPPVTVMAVLTISIPSIFIVRIIIMFATVQVSNNRHLIVIDCSTFFATCDRVEFVISKLTVFFY